MFHYQLLIAIYVGPKTRIVSQYTGHLAISQLNWANQSVVITLCNYLSNICQSSDDWPRQMITGDQVSRIQKQPAGHYISDYISGMLF